MNYQLDTPQEFNDIDTFIRALAKDDCATMTIGMEREVVKVKKWVDIQTVVSDSDKSLFQKITDITKNIIGGKRIQEKEEVNIRHTTTVLRIEDVLVPVAARNNIQKEPWIGYFDYKTFSQMQSMNAGREYYVNLELEKLQKKETKTTQQNQTKKNEDDAQLRVRDDGSRLANCVLYIKEDINGTGELEDMILVFHYDSGTFLRLQYNQFFHGKRSMVSGSALPDRAITGCATRHTVCA